jgi:hypothetical protein
MDDPYVLQILDPWSLMYGEYEDDFIEVLRQRIGPKHPLYTYLPSLILHKPLIGL